MGIGSSTRSAVTTAINLLGSSVTITPYTQTSSDLGYSGQVPTDTTATIETAAPFSEMKTIIKGDFGNLETGQFQLALKYSATFDITGSTKYKVTWQSEVYDITRMDRFSLDDVLVAWIITCSKRFD